MSDKDLKVIENIEKEISKIDKKENRIYFFVIDTKGVPSGSLEYIYNLALILKGEGYDVNMLHTEEEFVGVGAWLGEEYTSLPHFNVNKGEVGTSPSDVLFIPEIYSQVMNQTRNLPCKRVIILQNYDYVVEQMPYVAQFGDFGILEGITNSDYQAAELKILRELLNHSIGSIHSLSGFHLRNLETCQRKSLQRSLERVQSRLLLMNLQVLCIRLLKP